MDFDFETTERNRQVPSKTRKRGLTGPTIVEAPIKKSGTRSRVPTSAMDVDFAKPIERHRRKAPGKVSYLKSSGLSSLKISFKFGVTSSVWLLFVFFLLRLVFMERGVIDYYKKENHILEKKKELTSIETENIELVEEIEKIQTSPSYQKKLAREHLGVIAQDEYLILFSRDSKTPSI